MEREEEREGKDEAYQEEVLRSRQTCLKTVLR